MAFQDRKLGKEKYIVTRIYWRERAYLKSNHTAHNDNEGLKTEFQVFTVWYGIE